MPKLKTKKAVVKRMRVTKTGKVLRSRTKTGHFLTVKNAKQRRRLRRSTTVSPAFARQAARMAGTAR
jgi:large subunit ribosomal protein L35